MDETPESDQRKPQDLKIDTTPQLCSKDLSSLSLRQLALVQDDTQSPKKLVKPFKMRKFNPDEDLECDESNLGSPKITLKEISGDYNKCQKRKRKTERELYLLRQELRKNCLWTRESIKKLRQHHEKDFFMSEQ